jgi:hypothetical protein
MDNDLAGAVGHADGENVLNLPAFVAYCYNELPSNCWGSRKKVQAWLEADNTNATEARDDETAA